MSQSTNSQARAEGIAKIWQHLPSQTQTHVLGVLSQLVAQQIALPSMEETRDGNS